MMGGLCSPAAIRGHGTRRAGAKLELGREDLAPALLTSASLCQAASGGGWPSALVVNRMEEVLHGGAESLSEWCFGSVGMTTPGKFEVNGGT